jgi:hypothetical protein
VALEPDQVYRVPDADDSLAIVENAGRLIETGVGMAEIESRVAAGQKFSLFDSDEEVPTGAVPMMVIETTRTLDKPEVFFYCDREKSPPRRARQVVALVPASPEPRT